MGRVTRRNPTLTYRCLWGVRGFGRPLSRARGPFGSRALCYSETNASRQISLRPLITLITDFGTADGYVAEVKGVLVSGAPDAQILDLTHDIPPKDIEAARLTLARAWRRFPEGTVHMAIVDPGVGGNRDAIAVPSQGRFLLGPDKGVLSPALLVGGADAVTLPVPPRPAPTVHGRDVFAPAAARLARGDSSMRSARRSGIAWFAALPRRRGAAMDQ